MAVTITETGTGNIKRIHFAWTASALGAASGTTTNVYDGEIAYFKATPDGVSVPSAAYDITITDVDSSDVLGGLGANLDAEAAVVKVRPDDDLLYVAGSRLTLNVTNAGNATKGTVTVYVK